MSFRELKCDECSQLTTETCVDCGTTPLCSNCTGQGIVCSRCVDDDDDDCCIDFDDDDDDDDEEED